MNSPARSGATRLRRRPASIAAASPPIGPIPPVSEAPPDLDGSKIEPALPSALPARPNATSAVIVTRPLWDRDDRRARAAEVEPAVAAGRRRDLASS